MMEATYTSVWHPLLSDPTERRSAKPRTSGKTMVIDKGLGLRAFKDLLETASSYIDIIKFGFGTSVLYPVPLLQTKIELAKQRDITVMPGGTFLEVAVARGIIGDYFETVTKLGFSGIEVSDGTIEMDRGLRTELIQRGTEKGLTVLTEYGKKCWGSRLELEDLIATVLCDVQLGAEFVTIEGRESGTGVGIFDENGECRDDEISAMLSRIPSPDLLMWEAPQKDQQVHLIRMLGTDINLGNIAPQDVYALEALRRGLRSDTFDI